MARSPWVSGTSTASGWEVGIEPRPSLDTGASLCGTGTTLSAGVPSNIIEGHDYLAVLRAPGSVTLTFAPVWPTEPPAPEC